MYLLGIVISICGNVLISISLNIQVGAGSGHPARPTARLFVPGQPHAALSQQKYTHLRQAERGSKPYYTSVVWWFGVILMGVGEMGNFAAYGFAPATLIAPLGCVSVIGRCDLFPNPQHTHTRYPRLVGDVKAALGLSPIKTGPAEFSSSLSKQHTLRGGAFISDMTNPASRF